MNQDWRTLPAYLLLLSKFRDGDSLAAYCDADHWQSALNERPAKVIEQFVEEGMLQLAPLPQLLSFKFKVTDLKGMLKSKSLNASGRKDELITRLIDNDINAMLEATKDSDVYQCTAEGMKLAESYFGWERATRDAAEAKVLNLLENGEYAAAIRFVANFEAAQVFARGAGVDWKKPNESPSLKLLHTLFNVTPKILQGIDDGRLKQLRPAAGMMLLWGTHNALKWIRSDLETGIHLDCDSACRMLVMQAHSEREIDDMESLGTMGLDARVQWSASGDLETCPHCRAMDGRIFSTKAARGLMPHPDCSCERGCRCVWLSQIDIQGKRE